MAAAPQRLVLAVPAEIGNALGPALARFTEQSGMALELATADARSSLAGLAANRFHAALLLDAAPWRESPALTAQVIGYDAIALIANGLNPATGLSSAQVRTIYSASGAPWPGGAGKAGTGNGGLNGAGASAVAGKPVVRLVRGPAQPERLQFEQTLGLLRTDDDAMHVVSGSLASILFVAVDPLALAYVSAALATQMAAEGARIKVLALDGSLPTATNLLGGSYPLRRPILLVTARAPSRDALRLAALLRGEEIAAALRGAGFAVPAGR